MLHFQIFNFFYLESRHTCDPKLNYKAVRDTSKVNHMTKQESRHKNILKIQ